MHKSTLVSLVLLLAVIVASPAAAQSPAGDSWQITIAPYFIGAGMNGTMSAKGVEIPVDLSFSDILHNLQFGAMGLVAARKGNWGFGGDAIWMSLGADVAVTSPGPLPVVLPARAEAHQGAFTFYGVRRLAPVADLMFGVRINTLHANLLIASPTPQVADQTQTWADPVVGLQLHTPENGKRWHAQVYTEIGGFGAGSTFTWQVFPTVGVNLAKWASLDFGYRWLDIDYSTGEDATLFKYNVLTQGPVLGFKFMF